MNYFRRTALLALFVCPAIAAAADVKDLIRQGTALHDQGRYAEAIAAYREVLKQDPKNVTALYELAFSLGESGALDECVATAERGLKLTKELRAAFHTLEGNCLDTAGKTAKAVKAYARGLEESPGNPGVAFNWGLAEIRLGHLGEARRLLKISIQARPDHASSHFYLAQVFAKSGYDVPALLAALRFLSLESTGPRAVEAARLARQALNLGVSKKSEKEISIQLNPQAPTDEGNFFTASTMLGLASAANFSGEGPKKSEIEQLAEQVSLFVAFVGEAPAEPGKGSFAASTYFPFLAAIRQADVATPFAYRAFSSLELPGTREWVEGHKEEMQKLHDLLRRWGAPERP
jgi:predicted TPR repeat methyltransferase